MDMFKAECGKGAKPEDGDEFVTCFANGTIIVSLNDGEIGIKAISGEAFQSDYCIPIYGEENA